MEEAGEAANKRDEAEPPAVNVMRITAAGKERHYIGHATGLLLEKGALPRRTGHPCAWLPTVCMPKTNNRTTK